MAINKNIFLHESDKAALSALQAIPGFTQLMKSYMKSWNEKLFYMQNMSSLVKIDDNQLKKYKDMLVPICEKLDIEVPDLFLQLNPYPNSYTSGDSKPFIVITSGLIENIPERCHKCNKHQQIGKSSCNRLFKFRQNRRIHWICLGNILNSYRNTSKFSFKCRAIIQWRSIEF